MRTVKITFGRKGGRSELLGSYWVIADHFVGRNDTKRAWGDVPGGPRVRGKVRAMQGLLRPALGN